MAVAAQNPMDLDYRALSNARLWFIGRLQTDADRARVVEGLGEAGHGRRGHPSELGAVVKQLSARWFVMRDVHAGEGAVLVQPRYAMSWLKGPMTRSELRAAVRGAEGVSASSGCPGAPEVRPAVAGDGTTPSPARTPSRPDPRANGVTIFLAFVHYAAYSSGITLGRHDALPPLIACGFRAFLASCSPVSSR